MAERERKAMTLNLTDEEMSVVESLARAKDLSKTAVIRQALRLYQAVDVRRARGDKLMVENDDTKEKSELVLL